MPRDDRIEGEFGVRNSPVLRFNSSSLRFFAWIAAVARGREISDVEKASI
jgi:hypothetical protein